VALHSVKDVTRPSNLEDAWAEKVKLGRAARFLAGGIDIVLYAPPSVTSLIDLAGLGLDRIRLVERGLEIGATATMTAILESEAVRGYLDGFLIRVLREVASPLQRNVATIGGTIAAAHPWSDVIPALLVAEAESVVFDGSVRTIPVESLVAGREFSVDECPIITAIRLPEPPAGSHAAFSSLTRTAFDVSILNVACMGTVAGGTWRDVRLSVGGTPALGTRLRVVEEGANGRRADAKETARIAQRASDAIDARDDRRAGADYRRRAARTMVARCLKEIAGESRAEHGDA
jgi:CO/xanthine dehydrogenase FAD-binding subunit